LEQHLIKADGREELQGILWEKYEAALRNLVTGITPKDVVYQRPARGGLQVDYVPVWWFIDQANSLFSYLWDFEILEQNVGTKQIWVKGALTVKVPGRTVVEHHPDGTTTETRYDQIEVKKTQFGGSDIKFYKERPGESIDIADDLKSAASDAEKKCFTLLGFAADIYGPREVQDQTGPRKSQLDGLYSVGSEKGWTKDKVDQYCRQKHGKSPEELEVVLLLGLIRELRIEANP